MPKQKLKLYVWENVLTDYSDGIMFAYAKSVEQARGLINKKMGWKNEYHPDLLKEPREIVGPEGFYKWGSS